ncbi:MAG: phosphotriesterase family protein [Myxococcota bacterium]
MSAAPVQTVTGPVAPEVLGRTLMHEHLWIAYPGHEVDWLHPGPSRRERVERCVERIEEMKALGVSSMLDPCPMDLGRDVELMAEVAQRTRFQLVCATGLYKEAEGATAYWKFKMAFGSVVGAMAELFIKELTEGVADTGIRAGIIKVGTGHGTLTEYERAVFAAAALASRETGAPITTHTYGGRFCDDQQDFLVGEGVPAHRIVIGHSCGSSDLDYHLKIARGGSYLGFDRFGLDVIHPDEERVAALARLVRAGFGAQAVVSHDSVWCWAGAPIPDPAVQAQMEKLWNPSHFLTRIAPRLLEAGVSEAQIEAFLVDNPRRFFAGERPPS